MRQETALSEILELIGCLYSQENVENQGFVN